MGNGYLFKCKNCRKRYSVQLGIGMLFPKVYRETLDAIYKGEYGKEWQRLCREIQYAAVDAERDLFICESCGNWKVSVNLSLYAPNDIEFIKNQKYGEMTDEGEKVPYVMKSELEQEYHLIKEYTHICSKCGGAMRKISDNIPSVLPCPKCCTDNEVADLMMWD